MLSIHCNSCITSWRNREKSWKNNRSLTFYKLILMGRNRLSIRKRWLKKFEKNNSRIVLNVSCAKIEKIYPAYVPKNNSWKTSYSFNDFKSRKMVLLYKN